ncbi:MAG: Ig-like domain-containing protein, partial [Pseudomonadota bacterium]
MAVSLTTVSPFTGAVEDSYYGISYGAMTLKADESSTTDGFKVTAAAPGSTLWYKDATTGVLTQITLSGHDVILRAGGVFIDNIKVTGTDGKIYWLNDPTFSGVSGNTTISNAFTVEAINTLSGTWGTGATTTATYEVTAPVNVAVTVTAVDSPSELTLPSSLGAVEDTNLVIASDSVGLFDKDTVTGFTVTLNIAHGGIVLGNTAGVTLTAGAYGSHAMTITGSQSSINTALDSMTYRADANYYGSDSIVVTANDGTTTVTKTISVTVAGINDAPVNSAPIAQTMLASQTLSFNTTNGNAIAISDVDAQSGNLTVTLHVNNGQLYLVSTSGITGDLDGTDKTMVLNGSVANINAALQTLHYVAGSATGSDTLTITTNDNGNTGTGGALSDSDSVFINIGSNNVAPSVLNDSATVSEDGTVSGNALLNDSDVDFDTLTIVNPGSVAGNYGSMVMGSAGAWVYTPNTGSAQALDSGESATDTFTYTVTDGEALVTESVTVTITGANDAPVADSGSATISEDAFSTSGTVTASDVDVETLTFSGSTTGSYGDLTMGSNGAWSFTAHTGTGQSLDDGESATESFTYTVTDGDATDTNTITVTITGVNDAPVADSGSATLSEDAFSTS